MDKPNINQHWQAAEAALADAGKATTATARQSHALQALAELAACDFVMRWPDVSYGPLA